MKIDELQDVEKIANIKKSNIGENLEVEYTKNLQKQKGKKTTIIETVNGEITNVFESSNPKNTLKFYEDGGIKGKPSESNFAKHELAKQDIGQKKNVAIYRSNDDKNEVLEQIKQQDGKYPPRNFQKNNETIPQYILDKFKVRKGDKK